jgi:hypothetical protein
MKRRILIIFSALALVGCASDPLMTGEPHDWVGHLASDLKAAMGEPTRIIHQSNYQDNDPAISKLFEAKSGESEIWEYVQTGDAVSPKESSTAFNMHGADSNLGFGAHGGINTTESPAHQSHYENIWRYEIKNGKVVKWYAARLVDGKTVWSQH